MDRGAARQAAAAVGALESEPSGKQPGAASAGSPAAMGTGSSREGKARTFSPPLRHWPGPGPGRGSHSAPSRPGPSDDGEAEYASAAGRASPLALQQPDSDAELLDQVLEECEEEEEAGGPRLLPTAPRWPLRRGSGDCYSRRRAEGSDGGEEMARQREAAECFLTRSTPRSNNFANQLPLKKPERQAKISYDCSEEELMATIEQEYCR